MQCRGSAGQGRAGQGRAGQGWAGQGRCTLGCRFSQEARMHDMNGAEHL